MKNMTRLIVGILVLMFCGSMVQHPLKMSTTKLFEERGQLKFHIRMFADDLSSGMSQLLGKSIRYEDGSLSDEHKSVLQAYVSRQLVVYCGKDQFVLKYKKVYQDDSNVDAPVVVMEGNVEMPKVYENVKEWSIKNSILFKYCPEQRNVVNIVGVKGMNTTLVYENEGGDQIQKIDFDK